MLVQLIQVKIPNGIRNSTTTNYKRFGTKRKFKNLKQ